MNQVPSAHSRSLRHAVAADFPAILRLNEESVRFLSPLTEARLAALHGQACWHRVGEENGQLVAFLLALREGADYDSPNYRWFAARYERFFYVDRVVVAAAAHGHGWGRRLYEDAFAAAAQLGIATVTCEFDVEPPNPVSEQFHRRFGFREVGRQSVAGGAKMVSLQAATIMAA